MSILIIGSADEAHSAFMFNKLQAQGETVFYFDTRTFPSSTRVSFYPDDPARSTFQAAQGSPHIAFSDIKSVYWRHHHGHTAPNVDNDKYLAQMAYREIESASGSFCRALDCLWVNSLEAIEMHRYKGYQLQRLKAAGLRVPETLFSNNPQHVKEFYDRMNGKVIFKPVRGGAHTQKLTGDDFTPERLKALSLAPVQFQEMIEGVDIRVYLIGDTLFAAEIQAASLDFRDDPRAPIVPITLPDEVARDCHTLAKELKIVFSGIDIRRTSCGEYVFIEGNPSPMFIHFENKTQYPISAHLAELLINPANLTGSNE